MPSQKQYRNGHTSLWGQPPGNMRFWKSAQIAICMFANCGNRLLLAACLPESHGGLEKQYTLTMNMVRPGDAATQDAQTREDT